MSAPDDAPLGWRSLVLNIAVIGLILGLILWIWTGEWRWGASGAALTLLAAVAGAPRRKEARDDA